MRTSPFLHRTLALGALTLVGTLALAAPAAAQVFVRPFYYGGSWSGPIPMPEGPRRLPRGLLFEEIADQGFSPREVIGQGPETVVVDATDRQGRQVRLTVDAFDGEIMSRRLLARTPPDPYIRPVPGAEEPPRPAPPKKRVVQAPKAAPGLPAPGAPMLPQGANPDRARPGQTSPAPVAPARDPSQWGKEG